MNKKTFFNSIILSVVIFSGVFLFYQLARAEEVQFGDKDIFVDFNDLPFNLSNWAPGMSEVKDITIKNNEDFDINLYFRAKKTPGDDILADVLTITIGGKSNHLSDLFNDNIVLNSVDSGGSQDYDIAIKFDEDAGNKYQDKTINFDFIITAEQTEENNGEIPPVIIPGGGVDGGGGTTFQSLGIFNEKHKDITETSATITWQTNLYASSQIIYSREDESHTLDKNNPPFYGYAYTYPIPADETPKTVHNITIPDLEPCITYYYRIVSRELPSGTNPEFSDEFSFMTRCVLGETTTTEPVDEEREDYDYSQEEGSSEEVAGESVISSGEGEVKGADTEDVEDEEDDKEDGSSGIFLADIGSALEYFGCLPWWLILILALYPLYKFSEKKGEIKKAVEQEIRKNLKKKQKIWFSWCAILVIFALILYWLGYWCIPWWLLILLILICFVLRLRFNEK